MARATRSSLAQTHRRLAPLWCHWLTRSDYEAVADRTNYARG